LIFNQKKSSSTLKIRETDINNDSNTIKKQKDKSWQQTTKKLILGLQETFLRSKTKTRKKITQWFVHETAQK